MADTSVVVAYADVVLVGTVTKELGRDGHFSDYVVTVESLMKGNVGAEVVVSQLGYREGNHLYQDEGQSLMEVGGRYLLPLNVEPDLGKLTLLAGPVAGRDVAGVNDPAVVAVEEALTRSKRGDE